jgi:hypothetical protein
MRKFLLLIALACLVSSISSEEAAACVKSRSVLLETGLSPIGEAWSVKAKRSKNGGHCDEWLFQVQFELPKVVGYAAATTIPVGGHTPSDFTISALDAEARAGDERAFSGYTGAKVVRVVAQLGDGTQVEIPTKSPSKQSREAYVWMRGFRYFVYYYSPGSGVRSISLLAKDGRVLYRAHVEAGGYFL